MGNDVTRCNFFPHVTITSDGTILYDVTKRLQDVFEFREIPTNVHQHRFEETTKSMQNRKIHQIIITSETFNKNYEKLKQSC